jgi:hypothetical protein
VGKKRYKTGGQTEVSYGWRQVATLIKQIQKQKLGISSQLVLFQEVANKGYLCEESTFLEYLKPRRTPVGIDLLFAALAKVFAEKWPEPSERELKEREYLSELYAAYRSEEGNAYQSSLRAISVQKKLDRAIFDDDAWIRNNIPAQVAPGALLRHFDLGGIVFRESPEVGNAIDLKLVKHALPVSKIPAVMREIEKTKLISKEKKKFILETYGTVEGSNPYISLHSCEVRPFHSAGSVAYELRLEVARSAYALTALRQLHDIPKGASPTFDAYFAGKNLVLGVEIALVSAARVGELRNAEARPDRHRRIVLQRRSERPFTYKHAWSVAASGFIEYLTHRLNEDAETISVVRAAHFELKEEIRIPSFLLPNEEHYEFFGVVRLPETNFTDVVGQCIIADDKLDQWYGDKRIKKTSPYVAELRLLDLTPANVSEFFDRAENRYVDPTAFLTIVAALRSAGFKPHEIWGEIERVIPAMNFGAHREQ